MVIQVHLISIARFLSIHYIMDPVVSKIFGNLGQKRRGHVDTFSVATGYVSGFSSRSVQLASSHVALVYHFSKGLISTNEAMYIVTCSLPILYDNFNHF